MRMIGVEVMRAGEEPQLSLWQDKRRRRRRCPLPGLSGTRGKGLVWGRRGEGGGEGGSEMLMAEIGEEAFVQCASSNIEETQTKRIWGGGETEGGVG